MQNKIDRVITSTILASGIIFAASAKAYAKDLEKGTLELSGNLSASYTNSSRTSSVGNDYQENVTVIDGAFIYYMFRNGGVGADVQYLSQSDSYNFTGVGAIGLYNFSIDEKLSARILAGYARATLTTLSGAGNNPPSSNTTEYSKWKAEAQLVYFPNVNWSVNGGVQYKSVSSSSLSNRHLSTGFGFSVYF